MANNISRGLQGYRHDDEDEQPAEGRGRSGQGKDPLDVGRQRAPARVGVDHQADQRQQRGYAGPLRQGRRRQRQQHQRAAHGIGREEVAEQADGLPALRRISWLMA